MKSIKLKLFIFAFVALILGILSGLSGINTVYAHAETTVTQAYDDSYITVDVGEDKVLHIVEELDVGFTGIAEEYERRLIAINRTGKGREYIIKVHNFIAEIDGVQAKATCSRQGEYHYIRVKNPNEENFGKWTYENQNTYKIKLEYDYDCSDDIDGSGALALNLFYEYSLKWFYHNGDESDVAKLHFTVNMPKAFDASEVNVLKDGEDVNDESGLTVEGNTISFSAGYSGINGCSLRVNLGEGYFETSLTVYWFYWIFVALFAAVVLAGLILTYVYR
ncbi:MAG: hypothetical protein K2K28_02530, partial [Clostridia bacterium]|nr:hypothetical protein [Clostridia bacterium]